MVSNYPPYVTGNEPEIAGYDEEDYPPRTRAEIDDLKAQWKDDPIWDIETTQGFEAHAEELLAYRHQCEAEWEQERQQLLRDKAASLGAPGNLALASYVLVLEARLAEMERRIGRMF